MNSLVGSLLPPAERPFGSYELIAKLATGGMAEILLAREEVDGERNLVVIKRVLPHLLTEARFVEMFQDEGRLAAQIDHPNVCRVFDSGSIDGTHFIAMEYMHGVPLSRMLIGAARTKKPIDIDLVVGIVMQCTAGLHHAHELRAADGSPLDVVHRDVSPPNVFVTTKGIVKMLDFGVAKARGSTQNTRTGTVKGKNSYMSPEQIEGHDVDRRSDVFSLGIVLWEALTTKRLFSRDTDFETFTAITKSDIPDLQRQRPAISDALATVVKKALSQDREDRYNTMKEFGEALAAVTNDPGSEQIGRYVQQAFPKELASKTVLTKNITRKLEVVSPEAITDALSKRPRPRPATRPIGQAAINEALSASSAMSREPVPQEASPQNPAHGSAASPSRIVWIILLVGVAIAVSVLLLSNCAIPPT